MRLGPHHTSSFTPPAALALALALAAVGVGAPGCDDAAQSPPVIELYIDGTRAPDSARIDFPQAIAGKDTIAAQVELRNLGPGALELTGRPLARLEKDDRLAFTATQPPASRFDAGTSASVSVVFHPHAVGHDEARIVIEAQGHEPFVIDVTGNAVAEAADTPALAVLVDGAAVGETYDFGAIAPKERKDATLTLKNTGTGDLTLSTAGAVVVSGDGFSAGALTRNVLASGEQTDVVLTFEPSACAGYGGTLTVANPTGGDPVVVALSGRGGTNPQGYDGVTEALAQPDGDVALADASSGTRRVAAGNLAFGSFAGRIGVYTWDGCSLGAPRTLSPTTTGLAVQLFGAQVALDDRGAMLLATARDADEAWLFALAADNTATRVASLGTLKAGKGNGRGAALSGDASAAFIGQPQADSGFTPHGVVLVYPRPLSGWSDFTEARFRFAPSNPTVVQQLGAWVESSGDGRTVVAGAFENGADGALGPPRLYLWEASGAGADLTWGHAAGSGVPQTLQETLQLTAPGTKASIAALALSRDGSTVALPVEDGGTIRVLVWVRPGATWTGNSDVAERPPTASVSVDASARTRLAVGPDGGFIIAADSGGARELVRPAAGWDASAAVGRRWNVAFFGAVALSPDGLALAGLDASGRGWLVWR